MKVIFFNGTIVDFAEYPKSCERITFHTKEDSFTLIEHKLSNKEHFQKMVEDLHMKERKTLNDGVEYILKLDDLSLRIGHNYDYIRLVHSDVEKHNGDIFMMSLQSPELIKKEDKPSELDLIASHININCFEIFE